MTEISPGSIVEIGTGKVDGTLSTKVYDTVDTCGHKFHPVNGPTTNCPDCWEAFFRTHEGVVIGIQSIIKTFGEAQMVKVRGTKFLKQYKKYAAKVEEEQRNAATEALLAASLIPVSTEENNVVT